MEGSWVKLWTVGAALLCCAAAMDDSADSRCSWSFLSTVNACKVSCKVLGHETGTCDQRQHCICSETDYNFFSDAEDWFKEQLGIDDLKDRMTHRYEELRNGLRDVNLSGQLKQLLPSKCRTTSGSFCRDACRSFGKLTGTCNKDLTDCTCSEEWVTPSQYGLCASESICRLDCQKQGSSTGDCAGPNGWDCTCVSKSG